MLLLSIGAAAYLSLFDYFYDGYGTIHAAQGCKVDGVDMGVRFALISVHQNPAQIHLLYSHLLWYFYNKIQEFELSLDLSQFHSSQCMFHTYSFESFVVSFTQCGLISSSFLFSSNHGISRSTINITSTPPYLTNHPTMCGTIFSSKFSIHVQ